MPLKISVVIPSYRRPALLANCLAALENQDFLKEDYEVIVVSDGPDETTRQILETLGKDQPNFRYLSLPEKSGPAAARNRGWQMAQGTLIAFTDDDTLPDENWLSSIWQAYDGQEEIAFTGRIKVPVADKPTDYERNTAGLETADFVTANCAVTKKALEKVGGFDERFSTAWREDSDLEFRLLNAGIPIIRQINARVVHPVRKAPWGISLKEQKKARFNALLYKKHPALYRKKIQKGPRWDFYAMVLLAALVLTSFVAKVTWLGIAAAAGWLVLALRFMWQRLKGASKKGRHVLEMIYTSLLIPFASVYWRLYGACRHRVLFL